MGYIAGGLIVSKAKLTVVGMMRMCCLSTLAALGCSFIYLYWCPNIGKLFLNEHLLGFFVGEEVKNKKRLPCSSFVRWYANTNLLYKNYYKFRRFVPPRFVYVSLV